MTELESILYYHAARYPLMQPADAVKLLYQNEFGGGHLIHDTASCLRYLRCEYDSVTKNPAQQRYEPIGNGILRVHLAAVPPEELDALGERFLRSAAVHQGSLPVFLEKLRVLERLTENGLFSFSPPLLRHYLTEYAAANYPAVSHSETYRAAYHPAYRVVCQNQ